MAADFFTGILLKKVPEFTQTLAWDPEFCESRPKVVADCLGSWLNRMHRKDGQQQLLIKACHQLNQAYANVKDKESQRPLLYKLFFSLDHQTLQSIRGHLDNDILKVGRDYLQSVEGSFYKPI